MSRQGSAVRPGGVTPSDRRRPAPLPLPDFAKVCAAGRWASPSLARQERWEDLLVAKCWPPPSCLSTFANKQSLLVCSIFCFFPRENHSTVRPAVCERALCRLNVPGATQESLSLLRGGSPKVWVACSRSRWVPGFPGREDTEPKQPSRWPKSSLCPQAPGAPALAAALHGKGAWRGLPGTPRGWQRPLLSMSRVSGRVRRGRVSAAIKLKESATYEWWVGLRREKPAFP